MNYYRYMENRTVLKDNDLNLYNENEGFTKGTIFKPLYQPYKNYLPKSPVLMTEKGKAIIEIQKYWAAAHDLGLYLDVFPNDRRVIEERRGYIEKYKKALEMYEKRYGAICMTSDALFKIPYNWSTSSWPWEVIK